MTLITLIETNPILSTELLSLLTLSISIFALMIVFALSALLNKKNYSKSARWLAMLLGISAIALLLGEAWFDISSALYHREMWTVYDGSDPNQSITYSHGVMFRAYISKSVFSFLAIIGGLLVLITWLLINRNKQ